MATTSELPKITTSSREEFRGIISKKNDEEILAYLNRCLSQLLYWNKRYPHGNQANMYAWKCDELSKEAIKRNLVIPTLYDEVFGDDSQEEKPTYRSSPYPCQSDIRSAMQQERKNRAHLWYLKAGPEETLDDDHSETRV